MKMRVVVLPNGQINIFADEGTFAEGKEKIEALLAALGAAGIEFAEVGQVEQHKHDHEHVEAGQVHSHGDHSHSH